MEKLTVLKDLLVDQICELYNAENQQRIALEKMKGKAASKELKLIIQTHLDETKEHIKRLKNVLLHLEINAFGDDSDAMHGLIMEGYKLMDRSSDPEILDASLIAAIQYIEHFEIAGYGTACAYARELGLTSIAAQLHLTLDEEKNMDERLSGLAVEVINKRAKSPIIE